MEQRKLKLPNSDWVQLLKGLYAVQELPGLKFALVSAKNIRILKKELADLEEVAKPTPEFQELSKKVAEIQQGPSEDAARKKAIDELEKDNKSLIEARKKQMDELQKLMPEEVELKVWVIKEDMLPETITPGQLNGLFPILM